MNNLLLVTDNEALLNNFRRLVYEKKLDKSTGFEFHYSYSKNNKSFNEKYRDEKWIRPIKIKEEVNSLIENYNLIFSLHCKQIFPEDLVKKVKCINIHPGLNPYNRGWFPQVFSIINGFPCGATIHEIDGELDHGPIICQEPIDINSWDTSLTVYNKILDAEMKLLSRNLENIILGNYSTTPPDEGNLNLKKDFDRLCKIDVTERDTFLNHLNRLRALTHGDYSNAFFVDENGNKVFVKVELKKG